LKTISGTVLSGTSFNFSIRRELTAEEQQQLQEYLSTHDEGGDLLNDPNQQSTYVPYNNTNRDNFGFVNIYTNNNPAPGELFFHRNSGATPTTSSGIGYGIMTSAGDSIFYRASTVDGANFHINLNGYLTALRLDPGVDTGVLVMDSGYNIIDVVHCQNGLAPTQHEQLFFPDGTKWFTCYDWQGGWDLSSFGGSGSATVNVSWIQAIGPDDQVFFEWRSDENFEVTDATPDISLGTNTVDPWHVNSLDIDNDGNVIASFRNMDRIVKINAATGNIMWHWGGMNSTYTDFATIANCGIYSFSHQHHVHRIANGNILMFDNGNGQGLTAISQPKEYELDEVNHTAKCVWFYAHPQVNGQNIHTTNQGSAIRLPNGNTIIGYGLPKIQGLPNGTEIDSNKNIVWEFRFKDSTEYTYRLYKNLWSPNVGIKDIPKMESNLQIFPNPSNDEINITMDFTVPEKTTISLLNLIGQIVYAEEKQYLAGIHTAMIDISDLKPGFYLVQVETKTRKMIGTVIIE
jgi:hypothetical protein